MALVMPDSKTLAHVRGEECMEMRQRELLVLQEIFISSELALSSQVGSTGYEAAGLSTYVHTEPHTEPQIKYSPSAQDVLE